MTRLKTSACGCRGWSSDGKTYMGYFSPTILLIILILFPYASVASVCLPQASSGHSSKLKHNAARRKSTPPKLWGFLAVFSSGEPAHTTVPKSAQGLQSSIWGKESVFLPVRFLGSQQHSPREHPIEVTKAGENLPFSLMAKLAGGSEPCICFLG